MIFWVKAKALVIAVVEAETPELAAEGVKKAIKDFTTMTVENELLNSDARIEQLNFDSEPPEITDVISDGK